MMPFNDHMALALTMIGEARGEGNIGMECVGHTIINRFNHPSWRGKTIKEICLKPYQYSCWDIGDKNREYITALKEDNDIYQRMIILADDLISGQIPDATNGATYYFRHGSAVPKWAIGKSPCYTYKNHDFYKNIA